MKIVSFFWRREIERKCKATESVSMVFCLCCLALSIKIEFWRAAAQSIPNGSTIVSELTPIFKYCAWLYFSVNLDLFSSLSRSNLLISLSFRFHFQINSKYSEELAAECLEWVKEITGEPINTNGDMDNFFEVLKDGVILCKLVNAIKPGLVKKINESKMAFKCMENITGFVDVCIKFFNVPNQETFQSVDLWERQNLNAVVICLQSLGRKVGQYGKPTIGPKEADKNVRQFTEDQLRAGETIISLQYGSNKGASQSGLVMGNTRHM